MREALISYAIMQISLCKKVWTSVEGFLFLFVCLFVFYSTACFVLSKSVVFCYSSRESRCGPTPRSVSPKCEPLSQPITPCTKTVVSPVVQTMQHQPVIILQSYGNGPWEPKYGFLFVCCAKLKLLRIILSPFLSLPLSHTYTHTHLFRKKVQSQDPLVSPCLLNRSGFTVPLS